ncbi:5972_t:CDS:1 [Acaulospora morrowiae]|uniref:5972_t:CDS:1 n=1 Tax=Acaulospora morrowiae TaxID=94023 RepID=A0A9N9AD72_9GLOM|nr:5972_t:CDS:1 [Acaulospora morrowiae]
MTATKPKTTCSSPSSNDSLNSMKRTPNGGIAKRTRGPINKRACQRCRQGKIKCDGDAEMGKPCSNCDPQSCVYDNSPRKNKQVEQLRQRMSTLEEQLVNIVKDVDAKLTLKDLEKDVLILLCESKELFNGSEVFQALLDAMRHGKLFKQLLILTHELLQRMSRNQERIPELIQSLQRVLERAELDNDPTAFANALSVEQYRNVNGEYELVSPSYNPSILLANSPVIITDSSTSLPSPYDGCDTTACLNSHSPSDDGSETLSGEYGSGSPPTPSERRHSLDNDSDSYHNSLRGSSHQVSTGYYYTNANTYYPSDYIEYPYYLSEAANTTSPTDSYIL